MKCVRGLVVAGAILGVTLLSPAATGQIFARQEAHRKAIEKAYADWVDAAPLVIVVARQVSNSSC